MSKGDRDGVWVTAQGWAMHSLGRLSDGIRLGFETGFDSGPSLAYGYRNRASGRWGVGRLIDRAYLNAAGWRALRWRRRRVAERLADALKTAVGRNDQPHLFDPACGDAGYIFDALHRVAPDNLRITLRDIDPACVEMALQISAERPTIAWDIEVGDSLDDATLAGVSPGVDVTLASGFYELVADDQQVQHSLTALGALMNEGGRLIYTGHPWHPQARVMARYLPRRGGGLCDWPRRPQQRLDEIVRAAGFEPLHTDTDERGIFTVSVAERLRV